MLAGAGGIACGNNDSASDAGQDRAHPTVTIQDFEFRPREVTVTAGDAITFTNGDAQAHTATADAGGFDSGSIAAGEPATVEVAQPGRYPYHCSFHPFMTGTVIVE